MKVYVAVALLREHWVETGNKVINIYQTEYDACLGVFRNFFNDGYLMTIPCFRDRSLVDIKIELESRIKDQDTLNMILENYFDDFEDGWSYKIQVFEL